MPDSMISNQIVTDLSIIGLVKNADFVVKATIFMMMAASIWSWTIIFDKYLTFKRLLLKTERFEKVFWSGQLLEQLYERIKARADHPMASVFSSAMYEWTRQSIKDTSGSISYLNYGLKDRIMQAMEVARSREIDKIEANLNFLATVGSVAPFVGLFGTVWGIMNSFQSIAASKNATLAVVAPGIAEALLATAIGLVVAIPAVIFYNFYVNKLNRFSLRVEDFSNELGALISRELDLSTK